jgi:myxalamid-type polyketide synthase MxaB
MTAKAAFLQGASLLPTLTESLQTLPSVLVAADPLTSIIYLDQNGIENVQNYGSLIAHAKSVCAGLTAAGLRPKDKVILQLAASEDILPTFWGCLFGGFEPVIVPIPVSYDIESRSLEQLLHLWNLLDEPLICTTEILSSAIKASGFAPALARANIVSIEQIRDHAPIKAIHQAQPDDTAFYTLSSGSTGLSKAVTLTHRNMMSRGVGANILCRNQASDVILSWLPFDHIGNISAYHLSPIIAGSALVYAPKEYVLAKPLRWLDLIDTYRITHGWAPNFAFALISKALKTVESGHWDLSCVKGLLSAGELISYSTVNEFLSATSPYGLRSDALISAFGMAEACSGVTYHLPQVGHAMQFHHIDRHAMTGVITRVEPSEASSISFASLGPVIPGVSIRIVDESNQVVEENTVGRFQLKGDAVMPGYYKNPKANEAFVGDGWFDTGDAGFISQGELVLIGRSELGIIVNGVNLSNSEIEAAAEQVDGVTPSYAAACAVFAPGSDRLKLALFFHAEAAHDDHLLVGLIKQIQSHLTRRVSIKPHFYIPVEKEVIPKTAIGKIQHKRLIQAFQAGQFEETIQRIDALMTQHGLNESNSSSGSQPGSELEQQIAHIWQDVLSIEHISLQDNFFELGGDSISLVQALERLNETLGVNLTLVDLFKYPSIEALVQQLSGEDKSESPSEKGVARAHARRQQQHRSQDIAVIGMSCRFPGADDLDTFWKNLAQGVESITFFGDKELKQSGFDASVYASDEYVKASPLLNDAKGFDAEFFGYTARDAELMDPQHRLFLECAWEAFEVAGYEPTTYPGVTGVYAGAAMNTYLMNNVMPNRHQIDPNDGMDVTTLDSMGGFMMMVANDKDYLTTRVSYKLNLGGPSINVQTACSTGLVTVHMACQSLLSGETDLFMAGGASVQSPEHAGHLYQPGMIVSPDGHVRSFDANAAGTIFGSGVGAILLKRLDDAIRDGDHIYAVVKGSAVNNDGGIKVGYMAPSSEGQASVVAEAIAMAGISPDTIGMVEAHGTGTEIGDPIEVNGLTQVFRTQTDAVGYCALGSVKTNVGHLQITSGTAGFIKTALSLHHALIPPLLNFNTPNPALRLEQSPFFINTKAIPWKKQTAPRRAGINSLGIGGTNAHAVLEQAPDLPPLENAFVRPQNILTFSARNEKALGELTQRYLAYLSSKPDADMNNVCFTANTGRKLFDHRLSVVGTDASNFAKSLQAHLNHASAPSVFSGQVAGKKRPKIGFLFTGQGAQYLAMGRELFETQPVFRAELERCDQLFAPLLDLSLLEVMFAETSESHATRLNQTGYAQPALFSIGVALAKLWQSWGVEPDCVMGHSLGEFAAACIAGVFSLEDGVKIVAQRARLMQALPSGGEMWMIHAAESDVRRFLKGHEKLVSIAAINGPQSTVISGDASAIAGILEVCQKQKVITQRLATSHAFHSPLMSPILDAFAETFTGIALQLPAIPLVSNLTGTLAAEEVTMAQYWRQHVRQAVNFKMGIETMSEQGCDVMIEIGPKPTLISLGMQSISEGILWLPSLKQGSSDWNTILHSLAKLSLRTSVDWKGFDQGYQRRRLPLPTYPFQHTSYWLEAPARDARSEVKTAATQALLGQRLTLPTMSATVFQREFNAEQLPFLKDHLINHTVVASGACHIAMLLDAARQVNASAPCEIENIYFPAPLVLQEDETRTVQIVLELDASQNWFARLLSFNQSNQTNGSVESLIHAEASVNRIKNETLAQMDYAAASARCLESVDVTRFFDALSERHFALGESYRWIKAIRRSKGEAIGEISPPKSLGGLPAEQLHPGLIDACFTLLLASGALEAGRTWLPFSIERIRLTQPIPSGPLWARLALRETGGTEQAIADVALCDAMGNVVLQVLGLQARQADPAAFKSGLRAQSAKLLHQLNWELDAAPAIPSVLGESQTSWLIFAPHQTVGQEIAKILSDQKQTCIVVIPGARPSIAKHEGTTVYEYVDPSDTKGLAALIHQSAGKSNALKGVVYLWGSDQALLAQAPPQQLNALTPLSLIQALIKNNVSIDTHLWFFTEGAYALADDKHAVRVEQTPLWGIGLSTMLERPELSCVCIDLDPQQSSELNTVKQVLLTLTSESQESRSAWRSGQRFVARLSKTVPTSIGTSQTTIQKGQTYLLTGATGGLGLATAQWLIDQGADHLLLLSRQQAKPAAQHRIDAWKENGVHVTQHFVDTADLNALTQVMHTAQQQLPAITGIVHCAGVLDDHLIEDLSAASFNKVFSGKAQGAWNLHTLTQALPLDFFVLFSSAASILGNRGQANYAAANAYLDAIAQRRHQLGLKATSINWGPWAEVGMAQSDVAITQHLKRQGFVPITPELGLEALSLCIASTEPQLAVVECDWDQYLVSSEASSHFLSHMVRTEKASSSNSTGSKSNAELLDEVRQASFDQQQKVVEQYVHRKIRQLFGLASTVALLPNQAFTDLGLDSLMAVQLADLIGKGLGQRLPVSLAFNYPNAAELVQFVWELVEKQLPNRADGTGQGTSASATSASVAQSAQSMLDDLDLLLKP